MAETWPEKLIQQLLDPPASVAAHLLLDSIKGSELRRRLQSVAKRGYLGCLPIARTGGDDLVLRLLPGIPIAKSAIGIAWAGITDGLSIAPRRAHLVAGRLAQIDCSRTSISGNEEAKKDIARYSATLGSEASALSVLAASAQARMLEPKPVRCGALWNAARRFDPVFAALGAAWSCDASQAPQCLRALRGKARQHPIVVHMRVGYNAQFATKSDIADDAWSIVLGDHVFDLSYTGIMRGPALGSRSLNALTYAVAWLRQHEDDDRRFKSPLWAAAQSAIDDPKYDGSAHLEAAMKMRQRDAVAAYVQIANAACYAARARSPRRQTILAEATKLAKRQGWGDLASVLRLSSE
jgi:hypothetical protein